MKDSPAHSEIIFFSRGRGRGHAIPDMAILDALSQSAEHLRVNVWSYGTGLKAFHDAGYKVHDLCLDDMCNPWQSLKKIHQVLEDTSAQVLISHEECSAIPAANLHRIPCAYLTHWFSDPLDDVTTALEGADRIIFIEGDNHFLEPPSLAGKVHYIGPVLRRFTHRPEDRLRLREEMGISADRRVILILTGTLPLDSNIADLVLKAYEELEISQKFLIWVACGESFDVLKEKCRYNPRIRVVPSVSDPDRYVVISDLAITRGSFNVSKEVEALGIPSITLSDGMNPIDDYFSKCLSNSTFTYMDDLNASILARYMTVGLQRGLSQPLLDVIDGSGARRAAEQILDFYGENTKPVSAP